MPRSRSQQCPQTNSQNRTPQGIRGQVPNVSIKLPVVNGVFGEGNYIVYLEGGSVVEDGFAGEGAEHLVTAVVYPEEFDAGGSVVHWGEGEVEAAFFVGQVPGIEIFFAEGEIYFAQFVGLSFVKKYIFACCVCVSEAAAEIEAKDFSVQAAGAVAPVPFVVEGPDASSPVHHHIGVLWVIFDCLTGYFYRSACLDTVELLGIEKAMRIFKRSGHRDTFLVRKPFASDIYFEIFSSIFFIFLVLSS